jgi:hypothetical protein
LEPLGRLVLRESLGLRAHQALGVIRGLLGSRGLPGIMEPLGKLEPGGRLGNRGKLEPKGSRAFPVKPVLLERKVLLGLLGRLERKVLLGRSIQLKSKRSWLSRLPQARSLARSRARKSPAS